MKLALLALALPLIGCASAPWRQDAPQAVTLAGAIIMPATGPGGMRVGGISGLDREPVTDRWVFVSDDRDDHGPARCFAGRLTFRNHVLEGSSVEAWRPLQPEPREPGEGAPDPESIRVEPGTGSLFWTSEGQGGGRQPSLNRLAGRAKSLDRLPLPLALHARGEDIGPRANGSLEGLAFEPGGRALWLAMEAPLSQDGSRPTRDAGALVRLTRIDLSGGPLRQVAYAVDPIPPSPGGGREDNGVSEILAVSATTLLVLERSGVERPGGGWTYHARVYVAELHRATDIAAVARLAGWRGSPARKRLLVDLTRLPDPLHDNFEGMAWGPLDADGAPLLVLASDDNFASETPTRIVALKLPPHFGCRAPGARCRRGAGP